MAQARAQLAARSSPVRTSPIPRTKPTILIAEDSADGREMMITLLGLKGYEVLSAENGLETLEVALREYPDLILIDLQLPKLDGLDVTRRLRTHSRLKKTPIIMVTAHDPAQHRQLALDSGCTDYLLKPINFDRLDEILTYEVPLPR